MILFSSLGRRLPRSPAEPPDRAGWTVFPERTSPSRLHLFSAYTGDHPAATEFADPLFYFPLFCLCVLFAFDSLTLTKWLPVGDSSHAWDLAWGSDPLVISVNGFMRTRELFSVGGEMTENPPLSLLVRVSMCLRNADQIKSFVPTGKESRCGHLNLGVHGSVSLSLWPEFKLRARMSLSLCLQYQKARDYCHVSGRHLLMSRGC